MNRLRLRQCFPSRWIASFVGWRPRYGEISVSQVCSKDYTTVCAYCRNWIYKCRYVLPQLERFTFFAGVYLYRGLIHRWTYALMLYEHSWSKELLWRHMRPNMTLCRKAVLPFLLYQWSSVMSFEQGSLQTSSRGTSHCFASRGWSGPVFLVFFPAMTNLTSFQSSHCVMG